MNATGDHNAGIQSQTSHKQSFKLSDERGRVLYTTGRSLLKTVSHSSPRLAELAKEPVQEERIDCEDVIYQVQENKPNAVKDQCVELEASDGAKSEYDYEVLEEDMLTEESALEINTDDECEARELCPTCLTPGRELHRLKPHSAKAYTLLLAEYFHVDQISELVSRSRLCWECRGEMERVVRLQRRVFAANVLLQQYGQCNTAKTPDSLTRLSMSTHLGWDFNMVYVSQDILEAPALLKRKRGRPRKHPLPTDFPPSLHKMLPPREKSANKFHTSVRVPGVRRRRKDARYVKVPIDEEELLQLREEARLKEAYKYAEYKCETCIKTFSFINLLERHNLTKHSEEVGVHACDVCAVRFADSKTMLRHRARHYRLHACGVCGRTCPSLAELEKHYRGAHDAGRIYQCSMCGQNFTHERKLRYHKETVHRPKYKCGVCNKTLKNSQVHKVHMKIHAGLPTLTCSICGKRCRGDGGLYAHMRADHARGTHGAHCAECGVQFRSKDGLLLHLRHSNKHATPEQLTFQCDKCTKMFRSETALNHHTAYYHLEYKCDLCNKQLSSRYTMHKHKKFVHQGYVMPKKHVCENCGKTFATLLQLVTHRRTHTGERPHACEICPATFAQRSTLRTHLKLIHHKPSTGAENKKGLPHVSVV